MALGTEKEIWEINPEEMSARNISSNLIIEALRSNIKDLPGGSIKSIERYFKRYGNE